MTLKDVQQQSLKLNEALYPFHLEIQEWIDMLPLPGIVNQMLFKANFQPKPGDTPCFKKPSDEEPPQTENQE